MMKKYYLCAVALLLLPICIIALPQGNTAGSGTYDSPSGEYTYVTTGAGTATSPYYSNITAFESSNELVTIQSALEGYVMTEISGNSFKACTGMTDLVLPVTLKTIGVGAFANCSTLEKVYFLGDRPNIGAGVFPSGVEICHLAGTSGWDPQTSVMPLYTYSGGGCSFTYYVINGEATVFSYVSGTDIVIPSYLPADGTNVPVTTIGNGSFKDNSTITSVSIPDTVKIIGVRAFYYSLAIGSSQLTTVILSSNLKVVCDEAFRMCIAMTDVDLHNVEYLGFEAFRMCYSLTDVVIPDSVTVLCDGAFRVCTSMVSLTIGSGVTDIPDNAFDHCQSLESVDIRGHIKSVGEYAFFNVVNLTSVLENISLPDVETIGASAFYGCINLSNVFLGNSLMEIRSNAFYECRSLPSLSLPASLEKVGDCAFYNCRNLDDIYFAGKMPEFGSNVFDSTDVTVHCTESNKASWSGFSGTLVVDSSGEINIAIIAAVIVIVIILVIAVLLIFRYRGKNKGE